MHSRAVRNLAVACALMSSLTGAKAQQFVESAQTALSKPTPPAASAPTAVPALIPFSGFGIAADGKAITGQVPVTFLIYKDETGGQPLFTETQTAAFGTAGRYEVQLGATRSSGIPIDLFGSGEARWLEVQIAGANAQPRALLVSVPYALKAGDASTLGGLPASAYVLAGTGTAQAITSLAAAATTSNGATPNTVTSVTTTGGTSGYLPVFNGASTVVNSILFQSSAGVGIGDTPNASYKLDVNGKSILRGTVDLPNNGNATSSAGTNSFPLTFNASAYNSSSKADVTPIYYWQAEAQNNNTASPGATLNLLYNGNNGTGAETGFFLNSNGTVHFPSAQTFNATSGSVAFNGTSTSGLGVEGTSTSGSGIQGNSTSSNGVYGKSSTGDGLQGLTAGTTNHTAGVYGVAGTGNTSGFTGIAGVWGDSNAHVGVYGSSTQYSGVFGQGATGNGVQGNSTGSDGVYGQTASTTHAGVYGYSSVKSPGVKGGSATGNGGEFYGGTGGNGVLAVGVSASSNFAGPGGELDGGTGTGIDGANGLYANGGYSDSHDAGWGIESSGGNSSSGEGGVGGYFAGGGSNTGGGNYGIFAIGGQSQSNGQADAAELDGNVLITGSVTYSNAFTQIDHPVDPADKYLSHASVQSSEMVNVYSGNVTTDAQGMATVQLPSWFQAVNGDLRYQLTPIGQFAQAMIASEVAESKFTIQTDKGNVKVSWQITGVRQDAYAKAHPLVVEETKPLKEQGFYMHPELYGQPADKQTEWGRHPNMMKKLQQKQLNAMDRLKTVAASGSN